MLNLWYSAARPQKLITVITVCIAIYIASNVIQLGQILSMLALGIGLCIHATYTLAPKLKTKFSHHKSIINFIYIIEVMGLCIAVTYFPKALLLEQFFALMIQLVGFSSIGFFLVSLYETRTKRR